MSSPLPSYTEAELRSPDGPNLPGLWTPTRIDINDPYAFFRDTDWVPVLNLAIITETINEAGVADFYLLAGSRPEDQETHPNVVSTPTQRISDHEQLELMLEQHFFDTCIRSFSADSTGLPVSPEIYLGEIDPLRPAVIGNVAPHAVKMGGITTPLGRMVRKLLADKLGFSAWYAPENECRLEKVGLYPSIGNVSMSRLLAGFSYVGENESNEPLYEPLVMIGAVVHAHFPMLFPRTTPSYNNLTFTRLGAFPDNVRNREVKSLIRLKTEIDAIMMCVRGLCLTAGAEISSGPDLSRHVGSFNLGTAFNPADAAAIANILIERDLTGEYLAAETNEILEQNAFSGERVAFERVHASEIRASNTAPDQTELIVLLRDLLRAAGKGFTFPVRKK